MVLPVEMFRVVKQQTTSVRPVSNDIFVRFEDVEPAHSQGSVYQPRCIYNQN